MKEQIMNNNLQQTKSSKMTLIEMVETALYAALIFLGVAFFRIPTGGTQFVHFGNALVVVGVLVLGSTRGAIAAGIGLFLFDVTHGYASAAPITVLESVLVCVVLYFVFEKAMKKNDKAFNIVLVALIAAITKIILNFIKYTFYKGMFLQGLVFEAAAINALTKITGTFGSALLTFIAVPLLYPIFKTVIKQIKRG